MAKTEFENLRVYRLSEQIADLVWKAVVTWSPFAKQTVGSQLVRAVDSIGVNIAEGVARGSFVDNRRHIRIARGSLNESKHWLRRAYRRSLLSKEVTQELKPRMDELAPMLNAYLRSVTKLCEDDAKLTRRGKQALPTTRNHEPRTTNHELSR